MSVWSHIGRFLSTLTSDSLTSVMDSLRDFFEENRVRRRQVSFSVSLIALSAKMAKADGVVTDDEIRAFREIFFVPDSEVRNVARLYNLARQDISGYESYAHKVRRLFPGDDSADKNILRDVLDALFHIAGSDGVIHDDELLFLRTVSDCFGLDESLFERMYFRHIEGDDPYRVLGADPSWSYDVLRSHYRRRVMESHPDRLIARGVPPEFVSLANERLAAINAAWDRIESANSDSESVIAQ